MTTRVHTGCARGSAAEVAAMIVADLTRRAGPPVLLVVFASTSQPLAELLPPLTAAFPNTTLLSATTAGELTEAGDSKGAVAYFALEGEFVVFAGLGRGLGRDVRSAVGEALTGQPHEVAGYPHRLLLQLLDALSGQGEEAVLTAALMLGAEVAVAGGAAGDDLAMKCAQVGLGSTVAEDAVVLASIFSRTPIGLGVCHGHRPLSAPLTVTGAEGSVVHTLEGRPAWEVWTELAGPAAQSQGLGGSAGFAANEESAFLLRYEAGLATGSEYTIRAPLARHGEGALQFACGIPEGAVIRITEGTPESQASSALEAARRARADLQGRPVVGALVFDCICRNLILGDRFGAVATAMSAELGGVPLAGFETYGEIALDAGDLSGFHNTTTVVVAFS